MSITSKKLLTAGAGSAAGGGGIESYEDLFHVRAYAGTGATDDVVNGIDLASNGGLVWFKRTDGAEDHYLFDSVRGFDNSGNAKWLEANNDGYEKMGTPQFGIKSYNSDGYTIWGQWNGVNSGGGHQFVAWCWRRAEKFFDIVTFTGNGQKNQTINHNLGVNPALIVIKRLDSGGDWYAAVCTNSHLGGTAAYTSQSSTIFGFNSTQLASRYTGIETTDTTFKPHHVHDALLSDGQASTNINGATYVAYLWASNVGNGPEIGGVPTDLIRVGSYYQPDYSTDTAVSLGFTPQFVLNRSVDSADFWRVFDTARGFGSSTPISEGRWNSNAADIINTTYTHTTQSPTGFVRTASAGYGYLGNHMYMAIKGPDPQPPSVGTDVFALTTYTGNNVGSRQLSAQSVWAPDSVLLAHTGTGTYFGKAFYNRATDDDVYVTSGTQGDSYWTGTAIRATLNSTGITLPSNVSQWNSSGKNHVAYFFKNYYGFMDTVYYTGTNSNQGTVSHNLGVEPEMVIRKKNGTSKWYVWHKIFATGGSTPYSGNVDLNTDAQGYPGDTQFYDSAPTATEFQEGVANSGSWMTWLFATAPGVSKVGSYVGNGQETNIDCGFTTGARFVAIRNITNGGDWLVFDTARGYETATDYYLSLNNNSSQGSGNTMTSRSVGFGVRGAPYDSANINDNGVTYIFLAIA